MKTHTLTLFTARSLLLALLASVCQLGVVAQASDVDVGLGTTREFVVTAYYSPLPGQCCYVMGSEALDKKMNGNGIQGADGTPVYPGMIAAPAEYPFGTTIQLAGIGTVAVHDRGGAINVLGGDVHRLDLWVGSGEEGLARALAFGKRTVKGEIVAPGKAAALDLAALSADMSVIAPYDIHHNTLLGVHAANGETSLSVQRLQEKLQTLGYFDQTVTGKFGLVTADALAAFNHDVGLNEASDHLSDRSGAMIEAVLKHRDQALTFNSIDRDSSENDILAAKRALRYLGFFKGRTTSQYDDALFAGILKFQQANALVTDETSPGAGRIGPKTLALVLRAWQIKLAREDVEKYLVAKSVRDTLAARGDFLTDPLTEGSKGAQVTLLQKLLVRFGLLPGDRVTGTFGETTKTAVANFQQSKGIVKDASDAANGTVGPQTIETIQALQLKEAIALVRGAGLAAL